MNEAEGQRDRRALCPGRELPGRAEGAASGDPAESDRLGPAETTRPGGGRSTALRSRAPASQPGPRASAPRADPVAPRVGVVPRDAGGMAREPAVTLPVQTDGAFPRVDVGCQIRLHAPSTQTDVRGDGSCPDPPSSSSGSTDRCSREIGFSCTLQFLAEMSKIKHL